MGGIFAGWNFRWVEFSLGGIFVGGIFVGGIFVGGIFVGGIFVGGIFVDGIFVELSDNYLLCKAFVAIDGCLK